MPRKTVPTSEEIEADIRSWFDRHVRDYCSCATCDAPPRIWSQYFAWLLDEIDRLRAIAAKASVAHAPCVFSQLSREEADALVRGLADARAGRIASLAEIDAARVEREKQS